MLPQQIEAPQEFWNGYVATRKPALFAAHSPDLAHLRDLWTDDHLINKAGSARVQVEQRGSEGEGFGKGRKVAMSFRQALQRMAGGDTSLYLTTQAVATAPDGHPALYASPVAELAADFPLVPQIMGRLVPQSINLWMGAAVDGSSSGLHCDYHENLYVLLRGRKRFRLYPPEAARGMYLVGKVEGVHPNGRIVFQGQGDILPDGSQAGEARQRLQRHRAEQELAAAEQAVQQGVKGAAKRLKAAERQLDAVLESALGDGFDDFVDDFDAIQAEEEEMAAAAAPAAAAAAAGDPESFSRLDLSLPDSELRRRFPLFPGKAAALEVEVQAGQMLYLPAGWFHEVTSYSSASGPVPGAVTGSSTGAGLDGCTHLALNFWYHPPDGLKPCPAGGALQQPYRQAFWPAVWEGRRAEYEARHRPAPKQYQQQQQHQRGEADEGEQLQAEEGAAEEQRGQAARRQRQRRRQQQVGSRAPLPHSFGLFGIGRRQHLHRFVTVAAKRKSTP